LNWLYISTFIIVSGCTASLKEAVYLDTQFEGYRIGAIDLLPPIDNRNDTTVEVDIQSWIYDKAKKNLERRGYTVTDSTDINGTAEFIKSNRRSGRWKSKWTHSAEWIKRLPSDKRWVMVVVLLEAPNTPRYAFAATANAVIAGFLYDRVNGKEVWRDKVIHEMVQRGLLGMWLREAKIEAAILLATGSLIASIPKRSPLK
jgi:hypothetical protein